MAFELESDLRDTVNWSRKWLVDFNAGKTQFVSLGQSNNTDAIDMKMHGSVLEENHLLRCWGWLSPPNWIRALTLSLLVKLFPKKIGAWFALWSFFLLWLLSISINLSYDHACKGYCCHVWTGAPSCYLELLDKLQKRICRAVGPSTDASLEPLAYYRNIARLNLFYEYHFGGCSSELAQLVPLPYSRGRSTRYLIDCIISL